MSDASRGNGYVDLRVSVNGKETDRDWVGMRLVQENSRHVVAVVTERRRLGTRSVVSSRTVFDKGSRIAVTYGQFPGKAFNATFRGYITGHKILTPRSTQRGREVEVRYNVIGTSKPMQEKHSGKYQSWSQAAKAIAKRHKLRAVVHQTPRLAKPVIQTVSDFRFLAEGSEKSGFRFYVDGSTLYFVDPAKMLNTSGKDTPRFVKDGAGLNDSLHQLEVDTDGSMSETSSWQILGLTPTGQTVKATSAWGDVDGYQPGTRTDTTTVESYAEAREAMDAKERLENMWVKAGAETHGDTRVVPGRVVNLQGSMVAYENRGLWIVSKVVHLVDLRQSRSLNSGYVLEVALERDRSRAVQSSDSPFATTDFAPESDDEQDTIPWDPMEEWLAATAVEDSAVEIDESWQAEFYGDTDL